MLDTESCERIARYALGECSAEEAIATRAWIDADPDRKALADELTRLADSGPAAIWNAQAAWRRFRVDIADEPDRSSEVSDLGAGSTRPLPAGAADESLPDPDARKHRRWRVAAAAAAIVLASGTVLWQAAGPSSESAIASLELQTVTTNRGQTAEIYLGDGTHVTLGVASTLRFPARFRSGRDVLLDGEAYFDVAPEDRWPWQPERPFSVHTEGAIARDLGTRFSVRAYPDDALTEVVVAAGAVMLAAEVDDGVEPPTNLPVVDGLILAAGDLGRLDHDGGVTVERGIDVDAHLAWMRGRLVFTDAPVSEVLARLERWFDLDLQLADRELATARVTATFHTGSPAEALRLLAAVLGAEMEHHDRRVELYARTRSR